MVKSYQNKVGCLTHDDYKGINSQYGSEQKVICEVFQKINFSQYGGGGNVSATLRCQGGDLGGGSESIVCEDYTARRLTPTECQRLQGFPDGYAKNLGIDDLSEEDLNFYENIFDVNNRALGNCKKRKTQKQIKKWLQNPSSDSSEYKMWGNSLAIPCAYFVMDGIAKELKRMD